MGLATALKLLERAPAPLRRGPRERGQDRRAPDGPQQRRHPLGPLLQAGLREGEDVRGGARACSSSSARSTAFRTRSAASSSSRRPSPSCRPSRTWSAAPGRTASTGVRTLAPAEFRKIEPHAAGIRALHVPATGIVDYRAVCGKFAEMIAGAGGRVRTRHARDDAVVVGIRGEDRRGRRGDRGGPGGELRRPPVGPARAARRGRPGPANRAVPRGLSPARPLARRPRARTSSIPCPTRAFRSSASTSRG